jgi:hypothetical protein
VFYITKEGLLITPPFLTSSIVITYYNAKNKINREVQKQSWVRKSTKIQIKVYHKIEEK